MITYLLAISSPTHGVPADMYYSGWANQSKTGIEYRGGWSNAVDGDHYSNGHTYYGIKLDVGVGTGGPLSSRTIRSWDSIRGACMIATHLPILTITAT